MNKQLRFIFAAFFTSSIPSQADILAEYDFNHGGATTAVLTADLSSSPLFAATTSDTNLTATNLGVGSGLTGLTYVTNTIADYFQIAEGNSMSDGIHADGGDITAFMDAAYAAGDYFEITLTADSGFALNLTDLTFDFARASRGTNDYAVRTSVDGFVSYAALEDQAAPAGDVNNAAAPQSVDLSGASFQGLSTITLHVVFDDRQNNTAGASASVIDDIIVNGSAVSTAPDSDGDGLSDELEEDFGTDPNNPDSDGDGQTDGQEAIEAGTDPTDPNSVLKITSISYAGNGGEVSLTWTSIPSRTYQVQASDDLVTWVPLGSFPAAAGPASETTAIVETPDGKLRRYYRISVSAP
ncbi:thrombospondin type 3 repeat-containing protein [Akkermansiaceae bacterium]|nr:thrombospondin type 3 repeat-containing protein [Akkermansiaceae bacterium]MDB4323526.1 thrombospondin type 3 repeat-containing protein [Akkermansiaceae bacterium]MDB4333093.1 thrombospondin type 3 repeat-containing protein [Akkermansiaceae bacterium]